MTPVSLLVRQVANTIGRACGVGNFAANLAHALESAGVVVVTKPEFPPAGAPCDVVIIHHEWSLFEDDEQFQELCSRVRQPLILFAHSPGTDRFDEVVSAYMTLAEGAVARPAGSSKPVFCRPHPAWVPKHLENRETLRGEFDLPGGTVVGSSGFLLPDKDFPGVLSRLLPTCEDRGWFIELVTSRWMQEDADLEGQLRTLASSFPGHLRIGTSFLPNEHLNRRLQACDLVWCWTAGASSPYGSGSISDQYASGTRVFGTSKQQHRHVTTLPNAVAGPSHLPDFVQGLIREVESRSFGRHDPSPIGWRGYIEELLPFLCSLLESR